MTRKLLLAGTLALLCTTALAAHAASPTVTAFGPRVGASIDPDQLVVGGQLSLQEFAPDWSFDPNLELGFGDHETVIAFNLDANYHLRMSGTDWRPYVGGGLSVNFVSWDAPLGREGHSDTATGLNLVAGFTIPAGSGDHWFTELRFGVGDVPTLKIMGGMNFGR
jgi:opacity protein-like surface antigen